VDRPGTSVTAQLSWSALRRRLANERRARLVAANTAKALKPPPPSAFLSYGQGSWIVPPARVSMPERISIGSGVIIHEHSWLSVVAAVEGIVPLLRIGDGTHIGRLIHIACVGEIEIGPQVLMAERVFIGDTYHEYQDPAVPVIDQPMAPPKKVTIGRGAFLGLGVVIGHGVTVGDQAYIGAGAVVTRNIPPRSVAVGNPARIIRQWDARAGRWQAIEPGSAEAPGGEPVDAVEDLR
jgi:acetyltransferase-like isoleucine patch superfamily enzyme